MTDITDNKLDVPQPPEPPTPPPSRELSDVVPGSANCFWGHRWGVWVDTKSGDVSRVGDNSKIGMYVYQERRCVKCNKVELNKEKITS